MGTSEREATVLGNLLSLSFVVIDLFSDRTREDRGQSHAGGGVSRFVPRPKYLDATLRP